MPQQLRHPCGCIETIYRPDPAYMFIEMCSQHLAIANNPERTQPLSTILPPSRIPIATQGIPLNPFGQFQMGGFGHPAQMPMPASNIRTQR